MIPQKTTAFLRQQMALLPAHHPLNLQFLADKREVFSYPDFKPDPLEEDSISPVPRLFHKYQSKVLINTIDHCSVFCRFCTRKRLTQSKQGQRITIKQIKEIVCYVKKHKSIDEVILSGGEVFLLPNAAIKSFIYSLAQLPQIKTLRFHTRQPIVDPQNFEKKVPLLLQLKKRFSHLNFLIVFHINHTIEINPLFQKQIFILLENSFVLKSQTVLLKDVNDDINTLHNLFSTIDENKLQLYYLHHLDKVEGSAHFFVSYQKGLQLMQALKELPQRNYELPRYVFDSVYGKKDVEKKM